MRTVENRARHDRSKLRYPSDLTDAEWALVAPLIPPAKRRGNKRTVDLREVVNSVMYVLGTGCHWRAIPKDLAPRSTAFGHLARRDWDGTPWGASTTRSTCSVASRQAGTPARRRPSLTARA